MQSLTYYVAASADGYIAGPDGQFDTAVMGRRTYQPALDAGIASPYPHLRQLVAAIKRNPIVLGAGVPLLDGSFAPQCFDRVSSTSFDSGVFVEVYRRGDSAMTALQEASA